MPTTTIHDRAAFIRALHLEDLAERLPGLPMRILEMQADVRSRQNAAAHPGALDELIEVDGRPVGRIQVAEHDGVLHVVDVVVTATERGRGVGTRALRRWLAVADDRGLPIDLTVRADNPAIGLYRRLGFGPDAADPPTPDATDVRLRRQPVRKAHP